MKSMTGDKKWSSCFEELKSWNPTSNGNGIAVAAAMGAQFTGSGPVACAAQGH